MNVAFVRWLLIVVAKIIHVTNANWITGNLCWSMPCMNGGSCFGSTYTYLCVCPVNYSGALCEKRLGICQESPCGNRGLCVETGLFSFECRCYFDYIGPLCEEHVPKNDASVWSSLIPVHTRVLFDILQEAYRVKANARSAIDANNTPDDSLAPYTTSDVPSSLSITPSITTMRLSSNSVTRKSETTESEHIIPADGIQLENIFPQTSSLLTSHMYTQVSSTVETIQQDDYNHETTFSINATNDTMRQTTESISTTLLPSTTGENQTNDLNITEDQKSFNTTERVNTMITSASSEWSSYNSNNQTIDYTTEIMENVTAPISNSTESNQFLDNTASQTTNDASSVTTHYSSNPTDNNPLISSEPTPTDPTSTPVDTSSSAHHQFLLKLCQQLLSQILPNVTSLSASAAIDAALSLSSGSPSSGNNSTDGLLLWIKEQLNSTTSTTTTTTSTTTITTSTISSSLPSLLINEKQLPSISLQRVDMDDVLHQMNNNIDAENN